MSESMTQVWEKLGTMRGKPFSEKERYKFLDVVLLYIEKKWSWDALKDFIFGMLELIEGSPKKRGHLKPMQPASSIREATRTKMLAEIVVAHATQDPEVTSYREEVLGGTLLKWSDLQAWITQEQEKECERPAIFLDAVPLPPHHDIRVGAHGGIVPDPPIAVGEEHPAGSMRFDLLEYGTPDKDWVQQVPVAQGGVLARLHHLSTTLSQRYHWQPAQATIFVLTGLMPVLQAIDVTWDQSFLQTNAGSMTALSRIVLTIDPTLSPKEVHNYFQSMRQRIIGAQWRDLNKKQVELAHFALHRSAEELWPQRMTAWNMKYPKWCYDNLSNFKRDCQNAIEKLLAPVLFTTPFFPHNEENDAETPRES